MSIDIQAVIRFKPLLELPEGYQNVAKILTSVALFLFTSSLSLAPMMAAEYTVKGQIKVHDVAPDFSLPADNGTTVKLSDFKGKKRVVIYFYPKDGTPICTNEACEFKNNFDKFTNKKSEVLGISGDDKDSHVKFKNEHGLPFLLLTDKDGKVRKEWGCPSYRVTYVIDKKGIVRSVYNAPAEDKKHIESAIKALDDMTDDDMSGPAV